MIELKPNEKRLLVLLLKKELESFESEEKSITRPSAELIATEEKYDDFLKSMIDKLEKT